MAMDLACIDSMASAASATTWVFLSCVARMSSTQNRVYVNMCMSMCHSHSLYLHDICVHDVHKCITIYNMHVIRWNNMEYVYYVVIITLVNATHQPNIELHEICGCWKRAVTTTYCTLFNLLISPKDDINGLHPHAPGATVEPAKAVG